MRLSRNIWLLAAASLIADISGEMLMAVLPFLLIAQGATGVGIGLTSGISDAVGHVLKPAAGKIADRTGRRKPLIIGGYLVAAVSRLGIALSTAWEGSLVFRSADRVGKGLRTSPRDALLAESVPKEARGRAFGIHRAADTAGAVIGVAVALAAIWYWHASPEAIVLAGAVVGLGTAIPLIFVREIDSTEAKREERDEPRDPRFGRFVAIAALFSLANVSYMFYVLRASTRAGAVGGVALYLLFNVVYVLAAYPAGRLADRFSKPAVLVVGWILFAASAAIFLPNDSIALAILAFALMGLGYGVFEGNSRAFAADLAGHHGRSTKLGWYHASIGITTVLGGIAAGELWDRVGQRATFAYAAIMSIVAVAALFVAFRPSSTGTR